MSHQLSRISPEIKSKLTMCLHESAKFPDYTSWKTNNSELYQWANKEGFLDIVNSTFPIGKKRVEKVAKIYKKGPSVVPRKSVVRMDGEYRTFGELLDIALTYGSYAEWSKAEPHAYKSCHRHEWLEAISAKFPAGKGRVWLRTRKECLDNALLYATFREWREKSGPFYTRASRKGWLKYIKAEFTLHTSRALAFDITNTEKQEDSTPTADLSDKNAVDSSIDNITTDTVADVATEDTTADATGTIAETVTEVTTDTLDLTTRSTQDVSDDNIVNVDITSDSIETNTATVDDEVTISDTSTEENEAVVVVMDDEVGYTHTDRIAYIPEVVRTNAISENPSGRKLAAPIPLCRYLINVSLNSIEGYPSTDAWCKENKATYNELKRTNLVSIIRHKIIQQNVLKGGSFLFVRDSEILLEELKALVSDCASFETWAELNPEANRLYSEFGLANSIYSLF